MNVGDAIPRTNSTNHTCQSDDQGSEDSLQDVLSNTSLHVTAGRYHEHPYIAKLGAAVASLEIIIMLGLVAASFVLPHVVGEAAVDKAVSLAIYYIMIYSHSAVWFVVFVCDFIFSVHHRRLKMKGYLRFYRSIKYLQRHPFCVKSLFQTVFLALTSHLASTCKSITDDSCKMFTLPPMVWIQVLTSAETAVMFTGLVIYLSRVYYQNKYRLAPDDAEDHMLTSFQPHNIDSSFGVGYRADNDVDDIIEHQADKIRSLQEQNSVLNRKLYTLSNKAPQSSSHVSGRQ